MTIRSRRQDGAVVLASLAILSVLVILGACSPNGEENAPSSAASGRSGERTTLVPIPPADLSTTSGSGVERIRAAEDSLRQALDLENRDPRLLAQAYGRLGMLYHAFSFLEPAEACYLNASVLLPTDATWHYLCGHVRRSLGDHLAAIDSFEHALDLMPSDLPTLIHLSGLYSERNRLDRAHALADRAVELRPDVASTHFSLGQIQLAEGNPQAAAESLERALELEPGATRVHYPLGLALRDLGQLDAAQDHLARAGILLPHTDDPRLAYVQRLKASAEDTLMRANLAMQEGQLEKALAYLEEAYAREPDNPSVLQNMGTVLGSMGRLDEAKRWIERALATTDDPALRRTALLNLADLAMRQGRHANAAARLRQVLEVDPEDEEAQGLLNAVLEAQRRRAADTTSTAPQEIPNGPPGVLYRATAAAAEGRWRDARKLLERGMAEFPRDAAIVIRLAQLLATCPDDGVRDGEQALGLARGVATATKAPAVLATMAMAMAELGRFDAAINLAETSVKGLRELGRDREADAVEGQLSEYRESRPIRLQSPGT